MLLRKTKRPFKREIRKEIIDSFGENFTGEQVLSHLFGDGDGWINSDYEVRIYEKDERTMINRINTLWVYPVYFLFVAPIKWILTGCPGFKRDGKFYDLLCFLIGRPY